MALQGQERRREGHHCVSARKGRRTGTQGRIRSSDDADPGQFESLRRKVVRRRIDNEKKILAARLLRPKQLADRSWNKWRPPLTLAEICGQQWPKLSLATATGIASESDDERNLEVEVLIKVRSLFSSKGNPDFLSTEDILAALNSDKEAQWADWKKGDKTGMTAKNLGAILRPFKIKSQRPRLGVEKVRGYRLESFKEAFESYLPPKRPESDGEDS